MGQYGILFDLEVENTMNKSEDSIAEAVP